MPRGGARQGAGRPFGSQSRKKAEFRERALAAKITPLELLCNIVCDETQPLAFRADCAKAAAPYLHPRLSSIEVKPPRDAPEELTEAQRREQARQAILEAFAEPQRLIEAEYEVIAGRASAGKSENE